MFAHERKPLRSELRNLCLTDCTCRCRVCAGHSVWPGDAAWILECDRADFAGRECCHRRAGDHRAGATHGQSSGQRAWQPPQAGRHSQPRHAGWGCGRIFCGYAGAVCGEEVSGRRKLPNGGQPMLSFSGKTATQYLEKAVALLRFARFRGHFLPPRAAKNGGEGGIRTLGCLTTTSDFESGAFNHSATSPDHLRGRRVQLSRLNARRGLQ